jgi:hypothetical protein
MKRKLIWLNIALAGLIAAASYKVSTEWSAQKKQDQEIRKARIVPPVVKPPAIPAAPAAVTAGSYSDIATKMLFSQERNPNVVVVVPAPPPPKPMPPLPFLHGVMGLPSGMLALMSVKNDSRSVGVHVGDKIGEFEMAALTRDEISLKWEDKTVTKSVSEMIYHTQETAPVAAAAPMAAASAGSAPPPPPAAPSANAGKAGAETGAASGVKNCAAGDNSPAGTEADGFRKVLKPTPFGSSCFWEPIK